MTIVDNVTLIDTQIVGGTTIGATGSTYTEPYTNKTFYISVGSMCTTVPGSGGTITIEGSYSQNGGWYKIWQTNLTSNDFYYSTTSEHHIYMRTRISGMSSGMTGNWMVNVGLQG